MDKKPFTAADPDGPAYDAMIAKEKRLRAQREARQYDKLSNTASAGSTTMGVGQALLDLGEDAAKAVKAGGKQIAKTAFKSAMPIAGYVLDGVDAISGYNADIARGFTPTQAAVRNGRRVGAGVAGGLVGGLIAGAPGAVVGSLAGPAIAENAGPALRAAKRQTKEVMRELDAMNNPAYWPTRRLPRY